MGNLERFREGITRILNQYQYIEQGILDNDIFIDVNPKTKQVRLNNFKSPAKNDKKGTCEKNAFYTAYDIKRDNEELIVLRANGFIKYFNGKHDVHRTNLVTLNPTLAEINLESDADQYLKKFEGQIYVADSTFNFFERYEDSGFKAFFIEGESTLENAYDSVLYKNFDNQIGYVPIQMSKKGLLLFGVNTDKKDSKLISLKSDSGEIICDINNEELVRHLDSTAKKLVDRLRDAPVNIVNGDLDIKPVFTGNVYCKISYHK